jgi:hypothetical protein
MKKWITSLTRHGYYNGSNVNMDNLTYHYTSGKNQLDYVWIVFNSLKMLFPDRKVNPVKIRLSVISNLLNEKKWLVEDVQQFAGHCWPSTTERLIRQDAEDMRELINKFHPLAS